MKIKLNKSQFEYLINQILPAEQLLLSKLKIVKKNSQFVFIDTDIDIADRIRDLVSNELQKNGFDINYELTSDGVVIEELIDAFYVKA